MSRIRLTSLVLCLLAPAVAHAADGELSLYLQPFPSEAMRLTFTMASVTAITSAGTEQPLTLRIKNAAAPENLRQRLLASGRLPSGTYSGFMLTVKYAALKGDRGESALAVPDTPVRIDAPFSISQQQSLVMWFTLKYQASVTSGFSFTPVFWAVAPPRPIADHAGFVSNSNSNTLTVFDKSLMQVTGAIATCAGPSGLALDQRRRRLYVACSKDDEIDSIDVATGDVIERTRVSPGDRPRELALTPDGATLLVVNTGSNTISFFDAGSLTRGERVEVGSGPGSITIEPGGRRAFVFNTYSSSVSVVDIGSRSLAGTVSTEAAPLRGQMNRRGDRLYVIHERAPYMSVLDARQLTILTKARLRTAATALAIDPIRDLVSVGSEHDTAIDVYDPNALMPLYSMRTTSGVSYLAIDAEEGTLLMVSPEAHALTFAGLADRKLRATIDVGDRPYWVAVMGEK